MQHIRNARKSPPNRVDKVGLILYYRKGLENDSVRANYPLPYLFCQVHRLLSMNDRQGTFFPTKLKRKPRIDHFDGRWIKRVYDADVWAGLHPKLRSIIQCVRLPLVTISMMGIYSPSK
jgi:hypothetical protein